MQPLSLHDWDNMDRNWIENLWDAWSVVRDIQNDVPVETTAEQQMQQSLVSLTQRGQ
mgnify:CR=1 FL=1|jgi:hypothetical protein